MAAARQKEMNDSMTVLATTTLVAVDPLGMDKEIGLLLALPARPGSAQQPYIPHLSIMAVKGGIGNL